ncbi:MAG TPA: hypothetical protein VKY74_19010 [Chloroflexia bacterium]|nr:hypothetical protein [Chloroflexia bacterium]
MLSTLTVKGKILGQTRPPFPDWPIPLPPPDPGAAFTLRDLISRVVREEVAAFHLRQEERRLPRVLSPDQLAAAAAGGKVDLGGHDLAQAVDVEAAVATALQAFEDRFYFVFLDGTHQQELDGAIALRANSELTFLRLVPLAGG